MTNKWYEIYLGNGLKPIVVGDEELKMYNAHNLMKKDLHDLVDVYLDHLYNTQWVEEHWQVADEDGVVLEVGTKYYYEW